VSLTKGTLLTMCAASFKQLLGLDKGWREVMAGWRSVTASQAVGPFNRTKALLIERSCDCAEKNCVGREWTHTCSHVVLRQSIAEATCGLLSSSVTTCSARLVAAAAAARWQAGGHRLCC
jgi:hypothetical protein